MVAAKHISEATLVRKGMQRIKQQWPDAYIIKIADRMTRGIPDVLAFVVHEKTMIVLALEFKTPIGRLTGIQIQTMQRLETLGHKSEFGMLVARVIRSMEDVEQLINDITN